MITAEDIERLRIEIIKPSSGEITLADLAARVINILLILVGVLAFIYLIYAGILYITSATNPDQAQKAQKAVINVIVGIIVVALAYTIVRLAASFAARLGF
ncbi:MAG: hypothetical protein WCT32_01385 [Patescibacteria group bacterium]|jgi:hypothetical protein